MGTNDRNNRSSNNGGDNENLRDVVAFIRIDKAQKIVKPRRIGYASIDRDAGKIYVTLQLMPTQGTGWDGTLVIEKRQERDEDADDRRRDERDERDRGGNDRRGSDRGGRR